MTDSFSRESFRAARLLLGLFIFSLGVVMTLQPKLGFPPWDVFHQGVGLHLGLTIGRVSILVSVIIVAIVVFLKEKVGFGTLANVVLVGFFVDVIMSRSWVPPANSFVFSFATMLCGFFVMGLGCFLYIGAGYGAGPRDSLMVVLTKRTGKPVGLCRSSIEATVLFTGWLLGGPVGWGTLISALGIGASIQIVFSIYAV